MQNNVVQYSALSEVCFEPMFSSAYFILSPDFLCLISFPAFTMHTGSIFMCLFSHSSYSLHRMLALVPLLLFTCLSTPSCPALKGEIWEWSGFIFTGTDTIFAKFYVTGLQESNQLSWLKAISFKSWKTLARATITIRKKQDVWHL